MINLIIPKMNERVIVINGKVIVIPAVLKKQVGSKQDDHCDCCCY